MKKLARLRSPKEVPTHAELLILNVLWDMKEATVDDVVARLPMSPAPNYKTVQSMLRIMESKRLVQHTVRGRAFVFRARKSRDDVGGNLAERLLDGTFRGSTTALLINLFDRNAVDADELDELEELIHERRKRGAEQRKD
jgi:predicted transcriptional regulator